MDPWWKNSNLQELIRITKRDKQGRKHCGWKLTDFSGLYTQCFLGTVISGKVKWGGMTEEVLWGQESQLFQTNSQQLFFFLQGGKGGMACTDTSSGMHNKRSGYGMGGLDEVTIRQLLYSLRSAWVLFTLEWLCWGLSGNVQARRLLINAVSGSWQHKQTLTQSAILQQIEVH